MAATSSTPQGEDHPVMSVDTATLAHSEMTADPAKAPSATEDGRELYSGGSAKPSGINTAGESAATRGNSAEPGTGAGTDGELRVWEARYSMVNFVGRIAFRTLLTIGLGVMAFYTWGPRHVDLGVVIWVALAVVSLFWLTLGWRMIQAHHSHLYELTNRRLFVSTGIFHRRRDMMELLRVKDVYTRQQSLLERWLGVGTVIVVPTEKEVPTFYLAGVKDPKEVMDLIWHHARAERDHRTTMVDSV